MGGSRWKGQTQNFNGNAQYSIWLRLFSQSDDSIYKVTSRHNTPFTLAINAEEDKKEPLIRYF